MRRKDREIEAIGKIEKLLKETKILHLALLDNGYPYIIPLHYGYEFDEDKLIFYMHCAKEGHKLDLIRINNAACIEIENNVELLSGEDNPCDYSSTFASVIARGRIEEVSSSEIKIYGLKKLMLQLTGRDFNIDNTMADSVQVLRFVADEYSAKAK